MQRKIHLILFTTVFCLILTSTINAQTRVESVIPTPNAINASIDGNIIINFDGVDTISTHTLAGSFFIYGSHTGLYDKISPDDVTRDTDKKVAEITNMQLKPGELISMIIKDPETPGFNFQPHQWQFSVRPAAGIGEFKRRVEVNLPPSSDPASIFAADLNNNSIPDLAVLDGNNGMVSILANRNTNMGLGFDENPVTIIPQPSGNKLTTASYQVNQQEESISNFPHITGGDLYGNGYSSIVIISNALDEIIIYRNEQDEVDNERESREEDFTYGSQHVSTGSQPVMSAIADFNNDGKNDIAVLASGSNQVLMHTWENDYDITREYEVGDNPVSMVARDFNNDGYIDLAVIVSGQDQIDFLENDREGGFLDIVSTSLPFTPGNMAAGNFSGSNSDGEPGDNFVEVAIGSINSNRLELFTYDNNTNQFSWKQSLAPSESSPFVAIAAGDFFGDSTLDLITTYRNSDHIDFFVNNANEEFRSASTIDPESSRPPFGIGVAIADFALNGSMDIAITNSDSDKVTILYNDAGTTTAPPNPNGNIKAYPNPFTPNDDGYNDRTRFDYNDADVQNPKLEILNFEGRHIRTSRDISGNAIYWDGLNDSGQMQRPGVYLYVIKDDSKTIASGIVTLAR